jgi:hypothetical protein
MHRYFFHIRPGDEVELDEQGLILTDHAAARHEALQAAKDMVIDAVTAESAIDPRHIEVTTSVGTLVAVVPLQLAIDR